LGEIPIGPPAKVQRSSLYEERVVFNGGSQLVEESYPRSVQKGCTKGKYGMEVIHGKYEKGYYSELEVSTESQLR
jgi:glucose-6-phosphate 1-dehydrogenase